MVKARAVTGGPAQAWGVTGGIPQSWGCDRALDSDRHGGDRRDTGQ